MLIYIIKKFIMKKYQLGIVIPTYNEAENIIDLIDQILFEVEKNNIKTKILFVDDNSPDNTSSILSEYINSKNISDVEIHNRDMKVIFFLENLLTKSG